LAQDGYEKNYFLLATELKNADFGQRALALGFRPDPAGGVRLDFLGQEYHLDSTGVRAADGGPSLANRRSLLIHYLLSKGQDGPGDQYLTLWQMPGFIRGRRDPGSDLLNRAALMAFGDDYLAFAKAAQALGGQAVPPAGDGFREWDFLVLPKVGLRVGHLAADLEFPAEIRTRFDDKAPTFLEFECLAFLVATFSEALAAAKEA
jgi:hypothetical protein